MTINTSSTKVIPREEIMEVIHMLTLNQSYF